MAPNSSKKFFERRLQASAQGPLEEVMDKLEEALYKVSPHLPSLGLSALFSESAQNEGVVRKLDWDAPGSADSAGLQGGGVVRDADQEHAATTCQRLPSASACTNKNIHCSWHWLAAERAESRSPLLQCRAAMSPRNASPRGRLRNVTPTSAARPPAAIGEDRGA